MGDTPATSLHARTTTTHRVSAPRSRNRYVNVVESHKRRLLNVAIGGAERLVVDAALGLQKLGQKVDIYTSHHDPNHCFEETRDGERFLGDKTLD